jgi:hypothetical protein
MVVGIGLTVAHVVGPMSRHPWPDQPTPPERHRLALRISVGIALVGTALMVVGLLVRN